MSSVLIALSLSIVSVALISQGTGKALSICWLGNGANICFCDLHAGMDIYTVNLFPICNHPVSAVRCPRFDTSKRSFNVLFSFSIIKMFLEDCALSFQMHTKQCRFIKCFICNKLAHEVNLSCMILLSCSVQLDNVEYFRASEGPRELNC